MNNKQFFLFLIFILITKIVICMELEDTLFNHDMLHHYDQKLKEMYFFEQCAPLIDHVKKIDSSALTYFYFNLIKKFDQDYVHTSQNLIPEFLEFLIQQSHQSPEQQALTLQYYITYSQKYEPERIKTLEHIPITINHNWFITTPEQVQKNNNLELAILLYSFFTKVIKTKNKREQNNIPLGFKEEKLFKKINTLLIDFSPSNIIKLLKEYTAATSKGVADIIQYLNNETLKNLFANSTELQQCYEHIYQYYNIIEEPMQWDLLKNNLDLLAHNSIFIECFNVITAPTESLLSIKQALNLLAAHDGSDAYKSLIIPTIQFINNNISEPNPPLTALLQCAEITHDTGIAADNIINIFMALFVQQHITSLALNIAQAPIPFSSSRLQQLITLSKLLHEINNESLEMFNTAAQTYKPYEWHVLHSVQKEKDVAFNNKNSTDFIDPHFIKQQAKCLTHNKQTSTKRKSRRTHQKRHPCVSATPLLPKNPVIKPLEKINTLIEKQGITTESLIDFNEHYAIIKSTWPLHNGKKITYFDTIFNVTGIPLTLETIAQKLKSHEKMVYNPRVTRWHSADGIQHVQSTSITNDDILQKHRIASLNLYLLHDWAIKKEYTDSNTGAVHPNLWQFGSRKLNKYASYDGIFMHGLSKETPDEVFHQTVERCSFAQMAHYAEFPQELIEYINKEL